MGLLKNRNALELYFPESSVRLYWLCENGHSFRASIREMVLRWRCILSFLLGYIILVTTSYIIFYQF